MSEKIERAVSPARPRGRAEERCGRRQTRMMRRSENLGTSSGKDSSSTDLVEQIDNAGTGIQKTESMSREWTNEKHCLYLNSMEASFVRQLHSHEYRSVSLFSQHSNLANLPDPSSLYSNANNSVPSGQFKVIQGGSWRGITFERAQPKLEKVDDSRLLLENPWIRHFRSSGKQEVTVSNMQENSSRSNESVHSKGQKKVFHEAATCSKEVHADMYYQNSVDSSTEVSDQNFVDEEHEGKQISRLCQTKKAKTLISDV